MKRIGFLFALMSSLCLAQNPVTSNATSIWGRRIASTAPNDGYTLVWSASQGKWIVSAGVASAIACVGTPGNTTGSYRQQCQTTAGAVYACNNAAGCTVAGDWVAVGGDATSTPVCNPTTASGSTYACPSATLSTYTAGGLVAFTPDVDCAGGATTIAVAGLLAKSYKLADGSTNPSAGTCTAGSLQILEYDGTVLRLIYPFDATHSGGLYFSGFTSGGTGIAARDTAGTAITWYLPTTNGSAGQVLSDSGVVACDAKLPAFMPQTCHLLAWIAAGSGTGSGTVTSIATTAPLTGGTITGSGTIALDTTKVPQKYFGTAAPGSVTGNLPGDFFTDTTAHNQYVCNAPSGTAAPACTSVTAAGWLLVNGGGGTGVGRAVLSPTYTAIGDGGCQDQTATWTGVGTGDSVILGPPSSLAAGMIANGWVSSTNNVTIRLCNTSGGAVTPGVLSFNGTLAIYNLSATAAIDFTSIADGSCLSNNLTVTGAAAGDPVTPKWPAALESGLIGSMVTSATSTVAVRLCNWSGAAVDPASATFGASIAK